MVIKSIEVTDITIQKTHCDYIAERAAELKALISYNDGQILSNPYNKNRALSSVECMMKSLNELKGFIDEQ